MINSFLLHLKAERKADKTVRTYIEAVQWFAAEHLIPAGKTDWAMVQTPDIQSWIVRLLDMYSDSYTNNQFRALQQFFRWYASEDPDTPRPNPMAGMRPPKIDEKLVPVFTHDELAALLTSRKGSSFRERRDAAILSLFADTGIRLAEMAGIDIDDVDPSAREAVVTGKGGKTRVVRYSYATARTLDRYLRLRLRHNSDACVALWVGIHAARPMTASGIYQMVIRCGAQAGVEVHPHKFRHHFSHTWLDRGGAEGDLKELNGWESDQMLRRYGASARGSRARRSYDRIMNV